MPTKRLQRVGRGQIIRGGFLSDLADFANESQGVRSPREAASTVGPTPIAIRRAEILTVGLGYLLCRDPDIGQGESARQRFYVAMPSLLRATSHDEVTFVYTDGNTRTASKEGETDETHVLTPRYVVGDMIMAASPVAFGTGLSGIVDQNTEVEWVDLNLDARAWAKSE